jgi:hypothetical protein
VLWLPGEKLVGLLFDEFRNQDPGPVVLPDRRIVIPALAAFYVIPVPDKDDVNKKHEVCKKWRKFFTIQNT